MKKRKLIESFLLLGITILLMISATFAWLSMDTDSEVNEVLIPVGAVDVDIDLYISYNGGEYKKIVTEDDMKDMFTNVIPGDIFGFKLELVNHSSSAVSTRVRMADIISTNENEEYDIRDIFYLLNGVINIDGIDTTLPVNNEEDVVIHDQEVSKYRLNNLIDSSNSIYLLEDEELAYNASKNITFTLVYDHQTEDINYQLGQIKISAIIIYFN